MVNYSHRIELHIISNANEQLLIEIKFKVSAIVKYSNLSTYVYYNAYCRELICVMYKF